MFAARTFITPVIKAAIRPQFVRVTMNNKLASVRAASTISDAIIKDHRELKKYYDEIVNNPDNIDHQTRYGNQFTWELARHSVAEELLIYPALEKYLGDKGKEHADQDRKEHHQVSRCSHARLYVRLLTSYRSRSFSRSFKT
jgi:hemerythrin superfamily protein